MATVESEWIDGFKEKCAELGVDPADMASKVEKSAIVGHPTGFGVPRRVGHSAKRMAKPLTPWAENGRLGGNYNIFSSKTRFGRRTAVSRLPSVQRMKARLAKQRRNTRMQRMIAPGYDPRSKQTGGLMAPKQLKMLRGLGELAWPHMPEDMQTFFRDKLGIDLGGDQNAQQVTRYGS